MRTRNWSIRAKIVSLLLVPLLTLIVMWFLATIVTVRPGLALLDAKNNVDAIGRPALTVISKIQQERRLSLIQLASGRRDSQNLAAARSETDVAVAAFRRLSGSDDALDAATDLTRQRLGELTVILDSLPRQRDSVDRAEVDRNGTMRFYTDLISTAHVLYSSVIRLADDDLARQARALLSIDRAAEIISQEDVLISAAFATPNGFATADLSQTVQLIGAGRFLINDTLPSLYQDDYASYQVLARTDAYRRLAAMENRVIVDGQAGTTPPFDQAQWNLAYRTVSGELHDFSTSAADRLVERTTPTALAIFGNIALAGVLGLITVVITVVASIRIGRSLLKRLAGLRQAALELAVDRLPRVVTRLRNGEEVDVTREAPDLPYGDDEIGQVGHAFNEVQRTAINSAVEEATVRQGLNEVFLNIARRSQTLLHRQLAILDRMERRTDDPTELEDLFRVDHLATRMRRHAEDLVILAGAAPGRGWRNPVPLVDVLRGAVSEVEDYARVGIRPMPDISLVGRAVGDVIHLLAELIENSTSFSPPHTRVNIGGDLVPHGFAIEIEDRGLGMAADALAMANERLLHPPEFNPAQSAQLGLFVVARLAARHNISVSLRPSPYGGITAVALIPDDLIVVNPSDLANRGANRRAALAALPPGSPADPSETRIPSYREIATAARPAITSRPRTDNPTPGPVAPVKAQVKPAARHARAEYVEPADTADDDGLPRRIRQRSIAPQLRQQATRSTPDGNTTQPATSRSPEQVRAMMSSFQAGMTRGRREAETVVDDGAPERDAQ